MPNKMANEGGPCSCFGVCGFCCPLHPLPTFLRTDEFLWDSNQWDAMSSPSVHPQNPNDIGVLSDFPDVNVHDLQKGIATHSSSSSSGRSL